MYKYLLFVKIRFVWSFGGGMLFFSKEELYVKLFIKQTSSKTAWKNYKLNPETWQNL